MTTWTPKLETLIRDFGICEEQQTKDGCNPKLPMPDTIARISFRQVTLGEPTFNRICAEMGITPDYQKGYCATLEKIIDLAAANNSDAADKLQKKLDFTRELNKKCAGMKPMERLNAVKRGIVRW